ncbi:MAG: sulfite exporter TauE/SafE family protein [bacterium]
MNYWLIFLTGLTSGGVACAAMQGGLLASVIANGKSKELESHSRSVIPSSFDIGDWGPVTAFLIAKLIAHFILGFLLGIIGSTLTLSLPIKLFFQGFAAIFMLATAANLLNLHPVFRYLSFTPPKFARKLIKNTSRSSLFFAPAILGLLTVFVPCGVTQAMAVLAVNSGNPLQGALIMGSFVAGTVPVFVAIGLATAKLSEVGKTYFLRAAAILLIGMALYSLRGIMIVTNFGPKFVSLLPPYNTSPQTDVGLSQNVAIDISNNGYSPSKFRVSVGKPVTITLRTGNVYSCAASFTFNAFGINIYLAPNTEEKFTITPTKKGIYTFSCSMGMYSGTMEVI